MGTMEEKRRRLLQILREKSYIYRPDPPFKLTSGRESPYYVDCRPTTHNAEAICLLGEIFFERIRGLDVAAIGGLTMGADPIAHGTALVSQQRGEPINAFSVRKEQKTHGVPKMIVGDVTPGDRVIVVDDVITTGGSTIKAIEEAGKFGLQIIKVIVLVDREEGGKEEVQKYVPNVESIITLSELRRYGENQTSPSEGSFLGNHIASASPAM